MTLALADTIDVVGLPNERMSCRPSHHPSLNMFVRFKHTDVERWRTVPTRSNFSTSQISKLLESARYCTVKPTRLAYTMPKGN